MSNADARRMTVALVVALAIHVLTVPFFVPADRPEARRPTPFVVAVRTVGPRSAAQELPALSSQSEALPPTPQAHAAPPDTPTVEQASAAAAVDVGPPSAAVDSAVATPVTAAPVDLVLPATAPPAATPTVAAPAQSTHPAAASAVPATGELAGLTEGAVTDRSGDRPALPAASVQLEPRRIVEPEYPEAARVRGIEGSTVVQLEIGRRGRVVRSHIVTSSGSDELDRAALRAANLWRFPRDLAGRISTHRFSFRLETE